MNAVLDMGGKVVISTRCRRAGDKSGGGGERKAGWQRADAGVNDGPGVAAAAIMRLQGLRVSEGSSTSGQISGGYAK